MWIDYLKDVVCRNAYGKEGNMMDWILIAFMTACFSAVVSFVIVTLYGLIFH